ncbi:MAG: TonB-dependent receptor [Chitinophagales bacterium]|nr:TonB-dependent receptor [Chitinophagales bacterium]
MKYISFILFLLSLSMQFVFSQTNNIQGTVASFSKEPILFASVALFQQDSVLVNVTTTDTLGNFLLSCNCSEPQKYQLVISSVGYKILKQTIKLEDTSNLLQFLLEEDMTLLKEVVVKAPTITRKADRYIVNIENSYLSQGNTALGVLQKTPGVWVSNNGTISIKGNQSVGVMVNNVLQQMTQAELTAFLQSLKSEEIGSIEVIRNPSAEFDAEGTGGIINIVLKKVKKDSLNGSLNAEYMPQGKYGYSDVGFNLNYKFKKITLQNSYNYAYDKTNWFADTKIAYPTQENYITHIEDIESWKRNNFRTSINYAISPKQSIGIQTMGNFTNGYNDFNTDVTYNMTNEAITGVANSKNNGKKYHSATTFNYLLNTDTLGSLLKVIADYTKAESDNANNFQANYSNAIADSVYRNTNPSGTNIYTAQVDYKLVRPKGREWKMGSKYSWIARDNELLTENYRDNIWQVDVAASNHFLYDEKIAALYGSFHQALKKWDLTMGVRLEHTTSEGNSLSSNESFTRYYLGIFPSVAIEYKLDATKGNTLYFNQSRRISRPAFNELNPYRLRIDNYQSVMGNPNLKPAYTTSFEIGYVYHNSYQFSVYYNHIKDLDSQIAVSLPNNMVAFTHDNFDGSYETGIDLSGNAKITKWWSTNSRGSLLYKKFVIDSYVNARANFLIQSTHELNLGKNSNLTLSAYYLSPSSGSIYKIRYISGVDLTFSQKLLQQRGKLNISLLDILNTVRTKITTNYDDMVIDIHQKHPTRTINISFSYSFSSGKSFNPRAIEQNNKEEKQRIGN